MIKGVGVIMLFYLLGTIVSHLIGGFIPGSVCGMLLLFSALSLGWVKGSSVKGVAMALSDNMALFFVPVGVGVMGAYDLISDNLALFIIVPIVTTVFVTAAVGLLQQYLERRSSNSKLEANDRDN